MRIPFDEELGVHPQSEGFTAPRGVGLRGTRRRPVPAAAALAVLRAVPQAGDQAGRPRARAFVRRCVHRRAEGPQLRLLRGAHGARLVAVGVRPRRSSRPRSGTSTSPTTTSPRPRWSTSTTWRQHRRRAAPGVAGGHLARAGRRVRRHGVRLVGASRSPPQLPPGPEQDQLRAGLAGQAAARSRSPRARRSTTWSAARRCACVHHGEPLALADDPVVRPLPEPPFRRPGRAALRPRTAGPAPRRLSARAREPLGIDGRTAGVTPGARRSCAGPRPWRGPPVNPDRAREMLTAEAEDSTTGPSSPRRPRPSQHPATWPRTSRAPPSTRPTSAPRSRTGWRARAWSGRSSCSGGACRTRWTGWTTARTAGARCAAPRSTTSASRPGPEVATCREHADALPVGG